MHFWIDKRSPQCGFGRSRVAASLSGVGGSGVSFGHPPRRSGGSKSSSSSNAGISVHRQQHHTQQQHHQHQQQQANVTQPQTQSQSQGHQQSQYHQNATTIGGSGTSVVNSVTAGGVTGATTGITNNSNNPNNRSSNHASTSSSHSNNNNNGHISNTIPCTSSVGTSVGGGGSTNSAAFTSSSTSLSTNQTPSNRNYVRPTTTNTSAHHYHNNNRQYQAGQQSHNASNLQPNSSNNNHSTSTTATTTMTQNVTSPTGNIMSTPYVAAGGTQLTQTSNSHILQQQQHQQQHSYQQQRYRHPQFGNMSVRTYQPTSQQQQQQQSQLQQHQQQQSTTVGQGVTTNQQTMDSPLNALNENGLQTQSPNQTANIVTAELYQSSPRVVSVFPRHLSSNTTTVTCDHSNMATITNLPNASRTMYASTTTHGATGGIVRRRNVTRSMESADLQFLPLHLKCGIFASLVLAIAFIVGIKVYFDNHGTKFEVGLFWLLTATFVFAFCFVSICKVPRILFAASSASSRSGSRDQTVRDRCSVDDARGSVVNSIDDVVVSGLHEFQQQEQLQQQVTIAQQQQVQAGPPPYHIAILLPETKAKEDVEQLEESPPPSYDKILI